MQLVFGFVFGFFFLKGWLLYNLQHADSLKGTVVKEINKTCFHISPLLLLRTTLEKEGSLGSFFKNTYADLKFLLHVKKYWILHFVDVRLEGENLFD